METGEIKPVKIICTVKNVIYKTNHIGVVNPIIIFNKNNNLDKLEIDSIVFDRIRPAFKFGLGIGSKAIIYFDKDKKPSVHQAILMKTPPMVPENCESCGTRLQIKDTNEFCPSKFCSATSTGFIYKLVALACAPVEINLLEKFIGGYVIGDDLNSIDSISEFKTLIGMMKHVGTIGRLNQWEKKYSKPDANALFELERKLHNHLKQPTLQKLLFWSVCNFPRIDEPTFSAVCTLDPTELIEGNNDKNFIKLSSKARAYIMENLDFILFLHKLFNSFGKKVWKS